MFTLLSEPAQSLTDLAAGLTDQALEILGGVPARGDSVETELKLWRVLTAELNQELRERYFAPRRADTSPDGSLERAVNRAALRVIAERSPGADSRTFRSERASGCLCQA